MNQENEGDAKHKRRTAVFVGVILLFSILFSFFIYLLISDSEEAEADKLEAETAETKAAAAAKADKTENIADPIEDLSVSWQQVSEKLNAFEYKHKAFIEQFLLKHQTTTPIKTQADELSKSILRASPTPLSNPVSNRAVKPQNQPRWSAVYPHMLKLTELHQNSIQQFLRHVDQRN